MLHWEDFGPDNGRRILERYTERICTFNDDMQGTGAIALAALLGAATVADTPMREQRIVIFGAGTAGIGIADQLRDAMVRDGLDREAATRRVWAVDRPGTAHRRHDRPSRFPAALPPAGRGGQGLAPHRWGHRAR